MIQNINDINLNKYIKDFNEIIEEKNINKKFEKIINVYSNIMNKNINECTNLNNNNKLKNNNNYNTMNNNQNNLYINKNNPNNNLNMVNNYINNNSLDKENTLENKIIFVTFTFQRNKKQIYIEIDINETFGNAIRILEEVKYN